MKKYQGTKIVMATPMSSDAALKKNYKVGNHIGEKGYEVVYKDGYHSWSPATVFDETYKACGTFLERLEIERNELNDKLIKLDTFLLSEKFSTLPYEDQQLLKEQYDAMSKYLQILSKRIGRAQQKE
nr:hypothetical protein [uncultured Prevotella sp.]